MNQTSLNTLNKLLKNLNNNSYIPLSLNNQWQAHCPIGIEVEVKWRYYFPELYEKYLKNTTYEKLNEEKKALLTAECCILEKTLIPQLEMTEKCGIEKGLDKYYEFAFSPVQNIYLVYDQIKLLEHNDLIPKGEHSIHFTIGDLINDKDSYYLLFLLEHLMSNKERIESGFHKTNPKLSSTWAKKGMGGIYLKDQKELKHKYQHAIELRTLIFNNEKPNFTIETLQFISKLADTIYQKQNNIKDPNVEIWNSYLKQFIHLLSQNNLKDENWKKPNLNQKTWLNYINKYEELKDKMLPIISKLSQDLSITL